MIPRWVWPVISIETRKNLAYRVDFWVSFLGSVLAHLAVAYFLWKAVFNYRGITALGGYSFSALMLYYLLVPTIDRMVRGQEMGFFSVDIYEGSLSRYLIYPLSFYGYKYVSQLSYVIMAMLQLSLALAVFLVWFGMPDDLQIHARHVALGITAAVLANYLYYAFATALEQAAFWADNVWSLLVMLRFSISLLGGGMVPLAMFPDWARVIVWKLPFAYMLSFPIQTVLGRVSLHEWFFGMVMMAAWSVFFTLVSKAIWRRGIVQYSGVGI